MIMSLLSGIAIYAGRFLRWNSWDVIARPAKILNDAQQWLLSSFDRPLSVAFPVLFGLVLFTCYLIIAAISTPDRELEARA
jgi:uncharacterized membrane protein